MHENINMFFFFNVLTKTRYFNIGFVFFLYKGEIPNIKNDFSDFFIVMGQTRPKSKLGQDQAKMKLNQNRPKRNQAKISSRGKKNKFYKAGLNPAM